MQVWTSVWAFSPSFPVSHLCCCGGQKLTTALPQRPSVSPPTSPCDSPVPPGARPLPSISPQRTRPGAQLSSPRGPVGQAEGGVPAVITLLDRVIRLGPGWHQQNSPSYTFLSSQPPSQPPGAGMVHSPMRCGAHGPLVWRTAVKSMFLCAVVSGACLQPPWECCVNPVLASEWVHECVCEVTVPVGWTPQVPWSSCPGCCLHPCCPHPQAQRPGHSGRVSLEGHPHRYG